MLIGFGKSYLKIICLKSPPLHQKMNSTISNYLVYLWTRTLLTRAAGFPDGSKLLPPCSKSTVLLPPCSESTVLLPLCSKSTVSSEKTCSEVAKLLPAMISCSELPHRAGSRIKASVGTCCLHSLYKCTALPHKELCTLCWFTVCTSCTVYSSSCTAVYSRGSDPPASKWFGLISPSSRSSGSAEIFHVSSSLLNLI